MLVNSRKVYLSATYPASHTRSRNIIIIMQECPATSTPPPETMIKEVDVESQPTSALNRSSAPSLKEQISKHLSSKIETAAGYAPLLVCCFATGLTDGTVYIGNVCQSQY